MWMMSEISLNYATNSGEWCRMERHSPTESWSAVSHELSTHTWCNIIDSRKPETHARKISASWCSARAHLWIASKHIDSVLAGTAHNHSAPTPWNCMAQSYLLLENDGDFWLICMKGMLLPRLFLLLWTWAFNHICVIRCLMWRAPLAMEYCDQFPFLRKARMPQCCPRQLFCNWRTLFKCQCVFTYWWKWVGFGAKRDAKERLLLACRVIVCLVSVGHIFKRV